MKILNHTSEDGQVEKRMRQMSAEIRRLREINRALLHDLDVATTDLARERQVRIKGCP